MPAYNASTTIVSSIESVIAQTIPEWELIVVDDGSQDDTARIVEAYADKDARIRVYSQANQGAGAARNSAIRAAHAEHVILLDSDDLLVPEYMSRMTAFRHRYPGYDIYSCHAFTFDEKGPTGVFQGRRNLCTPYEVTASDMLGGNQIYVSAVVRRDAVLGIGGFRPERYAEDYDLWVRLLVSGARHLANPQELGGYNLCGGKSADRSRELRSASDTWLEVLSSRDPGVPERDSIRQAVQRFEAMAARWSAEHAAEMGEYGPIRRLDRRARGAYRNGVTFWSARLLASVAPWAYMSLVHRARARGSCRGTGP